MGLNDLIPDDDEKKSKKKKKKKFSPAQKPPSSLSNRDPNKDIKRVPHDKHGDARACPFCACVSEEKTEDDAWVCINEKCDTDEFLATWGSMHIHTGFLYDVDMVVINNELRDIIPYIK